jgi:hypothetical protein
VSRRAGSAFGKPASLLRAVRQKRGHLQRCAAAQRLPAARPCPANHRLAGRREPSLGGRSPRSSCDVPGDDPQANTLRAYQRPSPGPLLTAAANGNSLNPCPAPGMSSGSRRASMVPLAALQARPLELDMRCGTRGGNSTLVSGLDQRVKARPNRAKCRYRPPATKASVRGKRPEHGNPPPSLLRRRAATPPSGRSRSGSASSGQGPGEASIGTFRADPVCHPAPAVAGEG